ncbi:DUF1328 family protein [Sphingomonas quercus]|uniref:UPF0391 membrane protein KOF26_05005 n=1 Tax=Sphingomonas quercus TaxID=2842451 RepID=A0ABS6BFZ8_9SPHN|nr:DUF1328 family protein [Sphingomonas quercus]MBU3077220.1 DUF1328 domain-containing protein [Sphingomonas quercus]
MLKMALVFLVIGLALGVLGFGGLGGVFVGAAKLMFFVAIALFLVLLVASVIGVKKVMD